jgi:hypothetical protein
MFYRSHFSCFLPISWAIAHIFWFPGRFPARVTTDTWFERRRKNLCFSCFLPPFSWAIAHSFHVFAHFMGFSAHFLVPWMISSYRNHRYQFWEASQKLVFFMFSTSISMGYSSEFSCFLPCSWDIAHILRSPGQFPATVTTDTWFERRCKNSYFSCFLPPFPWVICQCFNVFCPFHGL